MNDIEEKYTEGIEKEGEIFLEGLQNKIDIGQLEKEYSKRVKEIRKIYEKSMKKELQKERESWIVKSKVNFSGKEEKEFKVQGLNLEKSWAEKKHVEISSKGYKLKRKIKGAIYKITPNKLMYLYYKLKRISKDTSKDVKGFLRRNKDNMLEKTTKTLSYIREGFLAVLGGLKNIFGHFKKKGKKKEEEKNKENGKDNAEKENK